MSGGECSKRRRLICRVARERMIRRLHRRSPARPAADEPIASTMRERPLSRGAFHEMCDTASDKSADRASPHRIRKAENRMGGVMIGTVRTGAGGHGERRSGIVRSLAAPDSASRVRQTLQGHKPQERRPIKRRGLREISATTESSRGAVHEIGPVCPGWSRTLARASNSPIGSAGPGAA